MTKEQALQAVAKYIANIKEVQSELYNYGRKLYHEAVERLQYEHNLTYYSTNRFYYQILEIKNYDDDEKSEYKRGVIVPNNIGHSHIAPPTHIVAYINGYLKSYPSDRILEIVYEVYNGYENTVVTESRRVINYEYLYLRLTPLTKLDYMGIFMNNAVEKTYNGISEREKKLIKRIEDVQREERKNFSFYKDMPLHDEIIENNPKLYADI